MSTIVVVKKGKRVVIGADTLHTQGSIVIPSVYQPKGDKIFKFSDSYIGVTGSSAFKLVLQSLFNKHKELIDLSSAEAIFETLLKIHPILKEDYFIETKSSYQKEEFAK